MESGRFETEEVVPVRNKRGEYGRRGGRAGSLKVAFTNINGLISGITELNDYLSEAKPDVMGIVETKLRDLPPPNSIGDGRYNVWIKNRESKQGGGVMILTRNNLRVKKVVYGEGFAEIVSLEVGDGDMVRDVIVCYVPPKTGSWSEREYANMISDTRGLLNSVLDNSGKSLLMGDFNCKEVCWEEMTTEGSDNSWGSILLDIVMEHTMTQWVKEHTRFREGEEPSRLDLIFTKETGIVEEIIYKPPIGKSDHILCELELQDKVSRVRNEKHREGRLIYSKTDFQGLSAFFRDANWSTFYEEGSVVEDKWKVFTELYCEGIEKYVPKVKPREKHIQEWFNKKCSEAKEGRDKAWKKWRKTKQPRRWQEYIKLRNDYVVIRREEKRNYEKNIIDKCKEQPKLFYRYINGKMTHKHEIEKLKWNNEEYNEDLQMAEIMNEHFQGVFTREREGNENHQVTSSPPMEDIEVTRQEIMNLMKNLDVRKSHGPDKISNWILKECSEELVGVIMELVKCSLKEGKIPTDWKRADIVPIFKGGNKEDPNNYRPVSLTSTVVKICERVIKGKWTKHLEENGILNRRQFGFRQGRSCATNLISYYSRVIDIVQDRDGWVDGVFLDLKKAFDKVPHKKLLRKLETIGGIKGKLLEWMKDFLQERKMRVTIRGKNSTWKSVISGVPQGSVLAPIMFACYVNDMDEGVNSYMSFFADDAKLLKRVRVENDCEILQGDLDKIRDWSNKWEMEFNVKKCSVIEFGRSKHRVRGQYKLGEGVIKKVEMEKDLGVYITNNLSPDKHINKIVGETYNFLRRIRLAFAYMDEDMVKSIICALIRPRLEYAAVLWSPSTKKSKKKLERIQRAATKLAPSLQHLPYEERLSKLGLMTLEERRERGDLLTIYRMKHNMEIPDRGDLLKWNKRDTRGQGMKLEKDMYRRDLKRNSFPHRVVDVWNGLDESVVCAKTINQFKANLDQTRYRDGTLRA